MLPTDSAKRILLQQHLPTTYQERQRCLSQLAANVRSLQQPFRGTTARTASVQQPLFSLMAGFSNVHGNTGIFATNTGAPDCFRRPSNDVLRLMLAAEQERSLKRCYGEIQQQQQQQQQNLLFHNSPQSPASDITTDASARISSKRAAAPSNETIRTASTKSPFVNPRKAALLSRVDRFSGPRESLQQQLRPAKRRKTDEIGQRTEESRNIEKKQAAAESVGASKNDQRWMKTFEELKEYKRQTGNCTVPRGYAESQKLASWVAEQRKQYKLMKDGRQSSITSERIALLDRVGFAWNAQEEAWKRRIQDLRSFKAEHGHCNCPLNDLKYPKLGLWVKEQRRHYTLMKQGKQSHMTEARSAELDALDFCWDTHENTWAARLDDLQKFKAKYGHCICPTNYAENPKLGTWIHHQRRQYKKFKGGKPCHITAERIKALDSLGFVWHPRDKPASAADSNKQAGDEVERSKTTTDLNNLDLRLAKRQQN